MIWILVLAIFICISSIFYPALRKFALCIVTTATVLVMGTAAVVLLLSH